MKHWKTIAIGSLATLSFGAAPIVPDDMELLYSYSADCAALVENTEQPGGAPEYIPSPCNGEAHVSVFANSKGERVYIDIPKSRYENMGKKGGATFNPHKSEWRSVVDTILNPKKAGAAIAFDAGYSGFAASASSLTYAHTVAAGSNRILFVGGFVGSGTITGVTYNGDAASSLGDVPPQGGQHMALWYLFAPDTGSNNVVISGSGTANTFGASASYSGALQSDVPDDYEEAGTQGGELASVSLTTVEDNAWVVATCFSNGALIEADTNLTERAITPTASLQLIADSNGPNTPAGSITVACNDNPQDNKGIIAVSFAPSADAPAGPTTATSSILFRGGSLEITSHKVLIP